jgi:hypothetical protein
MDYFLASRINDLKNIKHLTVMKSHLFASRVVQYGILTAIRSVYHAPLHSNSVMAHYLFIKTHLLQSSYPTRRQRKVYASATNMLRCSDICNKIILPFSVSFVTAFYLQSVLVHSANCVKDVYSGM